MAGAAVMLALLIGPAAAAVPACPISAPAAAAIVGAMDDTIAQGVMRIRLDWIDQRRRDIGDKLAAALTACQSAKLTWDYGTVSADVTRCSDRAATVTLMVQESGPPENGAMGFGMVKRVLDSEVSDGVGCPKP